MFGIGTLVGRMLGTDKAMESAIDGVKNGLDKLFYTEQEKAEDGRKERSEARSMIIGWMDTTKGQNLARRVIALAITFTWLAQFWMAWLFDMLAIFLETSEDILKAASASCDLRAEKMVGAVMLILGFYFAAPHMAKVVEAGLNKFSKSNDIEPEPRREPTPPSKPFTPAPPPAPPKMENIN